MKNTIVEFSGYVCVLQKHYYHNGRRGIILADKDSGARVAVATVNLDDVSIQDDTVLIKDYSENKGMLKCLVDARIISKPMSTHKVGFVEIYKCKLLKCQICEDDETIKHLCNTCAQEVIKNSKLN